VAAKYNIPRPYVSLAIVIFLFLFIFVGVGASLLSQLVGFAYPAYGSFKAIESPTKDDDTQWLTYWVVFAIFSVLETFSDTILWWFPLYYTGKILFLVWCQAPLTRGAEFMYTHFLRAWFLAYQSKIDTYLATASSAATAIGAEAVAAGVRAGQAEKKST
jgi:receptor expression-enhancing protein 5/6